MYFSSDILFKEVSYNNDTGNKFIKICEELRPSVKEPKKKECIPPFKVKNLPKKLNWCHVTDCLIDAYDHLLNQDGMVSYS